MRLWTWDVEQVQCFSLADMLEISNPCLRFAWSMKLLCRRMVHAHEMTLKHKEPELQRLVCTEETTNGSLEFRIVLVMNKYLMMLRVCCHMAAIVKVSACLLKLTEGFNQPPGRHSESCRCAVPAEPACGWPWPLPWHSPRRSSRTWLVRKVMKVVQTLTWEPGGDISILKVEGGMASCVILSTLRTRHLLGPSPRTVARLMQVVQTLTWKPGGDISILKLEGGMASCVILSTLRTWHFPYLFLGRRKATKMLQVVQNLTWEPGDDISIFKVIGGPDLFPHSEHSSDDWEGWAIETTSMAPPPFLCWWFLGDWI